jgi:uncharacterized membrane protein
MRARAQMIVDGRISEAESLWYDTRRWPTFIDGFHHVTKGLSSWPADGPLVWDSVPQGRGRVIERVVRYEPRVGQTVEVEDTKITGTQTIQFDAVEDDRTRVTIELDYHVKEMRGGPAGKVVDWLFIRPRQREALARTLMRFARELAADRRDLEAR